ncbi:hypothetical protein DFH09DRAFT_1436700 [Mycena vulgaris]|nr:hypothetical protein DFH09DRAFT_1436700 [Mycena vulgaris]
MASSPLQAPHSPPATALRIRLAEIDSEIGELQARLDHLAVTRKPVADALESIVYPILTVPPEITTEIFIHYIALNPLVDLHDSRSGPLLLASICRTWRSIAINLRPIWSRIQISPTPQSLSSTKELLQCWLPRAGSHPLDLDIDTSADGVDDLINALAPSSTQWRNFCFRPKLPIVLPISDLQGCIPLLRKLSVIPGVLYEMDDAPNLPPITAFLEAPQLRDILDRTSYLETLCLSRIWVSTRDEPLPLARLEYLHTLILELDWDGLRLFDRIVCPALKCLSLPPSFEQEAPHLLAFLFRCSLSSISLSRLAPSLVASVLEAVSTVTELSLHISGWDHAQFASLFNQIAIDKDLLPNLETLYLEEVDSSLPYAELCDMLESRWHGRNNESARLKSFRFIRPYTMEFEPTISRRLQAFVDDDLKIDIRRQPLDAWLLPYADR